MIGTEDYYDDGLDDNSSFDDYIPKTVDPGNWMFIGVSLYSLLCLCVLPFLVICGNRLEKRRVDREEWARLEKEAHELELAEEVAEAKEEIAHIGAIETEFVQESDHCRRGTKIHTISSKKSIHDNYAVSVIRTIQFHVSFLYFDYLHHSNIPNAYAMIDASIQQWWQKHFGESCGKCNE